MCLQMPGLNLFNMCKYESNSEWIQEKDSGKRVYMRDTNTKKAVFPEVRLQEAWLSGRA